jgi:hypothetical protein
MTNSKKYHPGTKYKKFILFKLKYNCSTCNMLKRCNLRTAIKYANGYRWPEKELCCSGYGPKGTTTMR